MKKKSRLFYAPPMTFILFLSFVGLLSILLLMESGVVYGHNVLSDTLVAAAMSPTDSDMAGEKVNEQMSDIITLNDEQVMIIGGSDPLNLSGVATSSALPGWPKERLIDENVESSWSSVGHFDHLASSEWAAVLLPERTLVNRMRIYPRSNPTTPENSLGFPKDFVIQYSYNGNGLTCDPNHSSFGLASNWRPLITEFGYAQPSNAAVDFSFILQEAACVRIMGTELSQDDFGNRFLQFNELELYNGSTKLSLSGVQSSSNENGWPAGRLIDGDLASTWSSQGHGDHLASSEWAAILLPQRTQADRVRIYPRANPATANNSLGFPKDFVIQYSYNGNGLTCDPNNPAFRQAGNWRPLITQYGYPQPSNTAIDFSFTAQEVACLRIYGTELSQDDFGNRFMQFNELELYSGQTKLSLSGVQPSSSENGWPASRLIDGDVNNTWSSVGHSDHLASSEWAAVLLPARTAVNHMRIYPRVNPVASDSSLGFPKDFVIQYSYNTTGRTCDPNNSAFGSAGNWLPLITEFGFPQPSSNAVDFTFTSSDAECVRIMGTELSQDDFGNRFMQFSKIELYAGDAPPSPYPAPYPAPSSSPTPTPAPSPTPASPAYP